MANHMEIETAKRAFKSVFRRLMYGFSLIGIGSYAIFLYILKFNFYSVAASVLLCAVIIETAMYALDKSLKVYK